MVDVPIFDEQSLTVSEVVNERFIKLGFAEEVAV
jgi:hypothetical protein